MKTTSNRIMALAITTALLGIAGGSLASADYYAPNHPYTYGHNGYWDEHHRYHHWEQHNGHQGYWNQNDSGARVFISL